jgi:flagellar motor protein MotB
MWTTAGRPAIYYGGSGVAAKGGGAWKVAYADFVTAMMAFFLVMWICAQDQKIKQSVARYFNTPMGIFTTGSSKKPDMAGSLFDIPSTGSVPREVSVATGNGRASYTRGGERGLASKRVSDWLHADEPTHRYWREQAVRHRDAAARSKDVLDRLCTADEAAARGLARQLEAEITRASPAQAGLYRDLMLGTLAEVNWTEIAEDLLAQ